MSSIPNVQFAGFNIDGQIGITKYVFKTTQKQTTYITRCPQKRKCVEFIFVILSQQQKRLKLNTRCGQNVIDLTNNLSISIF